MCECFAVCLSKPTDWPIVKSLVLIILVLLQCGCQSSSRTADRGVLTPAVAVSEGNVTDSIPKLVTDSVAGSNTRTTDTFAEASGPLNGHNEQSLNVTPVSMTHLLLSDTGKTSPDSGDDVPGSVGDVALETSKKVTLQQVIQSLHQSYPLVQAAYQERVIADGNRISSWGEFDTKIKASSENGPLGFYETYRNSAGVTKPIYNGGEFFAGYRNGGGDFQPWYKERETNDGGEFKAGVRVPLIRDRDIDGRRAALWRATYDQQTADPVIQASLVQFSREAGLAYWKWVGAGQKYKLGQQWLELAEARNDRITRRVELEDLDPPELIDNERAIAKRRAKLSDARRDLQQAAIKLSLFLRDENGVPNVASLDELPAFPGLRDISESMMAFDIQRAQQARPELAAIDLQLKQLQVDYAEACNQIRPGLDARLTGSQDVGAPTSSKRDKSEFELEAGLFFEIPVERRKGRGKMQAVQGKMAQVTAKRRLVQDKISAEVQAVYAGLMQSRLEALNARRAVQLATRMAEIERRKFELGESDLLKVALREQYALEAAEEEVSAMYNHFAAFSEYAAALAIDRPSEELLLKDGNE